METIPMSETKFIVEIQNKTPIELVDFTNSFYSLAMEYNKFLNDTAGFKLTNDSKLYVEEIKKGSIIAVLSDTTPLIIPFVENANSIIEFAGFLKKGMNWLLNKIDDKPKLDNADLKNIQSILTPVAKDSASQVNFTVKNINIENLNLQFGFDSIQSNAIQNVIKGLLNESKQASTNIQEKQLFYWDSAKQGANSKTIDRGYIDNIYTKPLRVEFEPDELKKEFIDIEANFFHRAFLVDVEVMTVQNVPTIYKIVKLHKIIDKET